MSEYLKQISLQMLGVQVRRIERFLAHTFGVPHEAVFLIIEDEESSQVLLQQRSMDKSLYPGAYTVAASGHSLSLESSKDATMREGVEELGLDPELFTELQDLGGMYHEEGADKQWCRVFYLKVAGKPVLNMLKDELMALQWIDKTQLSDMLERENFTPFARIVLNYFLRLDIESKA